MTAIPSNSLAVPGALVLDANIPIALVANETGASIVQDILQYYATQGYEPFAPGLIVSETLYVLCGKLQDGSLNSNEYSVAVSAFSSFMQDVLPTPGGDSTLIVRAEVIRGSYTCRRSADGVYIALAESLTQSRPTRLLTFDEDMKKQAARYAATVQVELLTP